MNVSALIGQEVTATEVPEEVALGARAGDGEGRPAAAFAALLGSELESIEDADEMTVQVAPEDLEDVVLDAPFTLGESAHDADLPLDPSDAAHSEDDGGVELPEAADALVMGAAPTASRSREFRAASPQSTEATDQETTVETATPDITTNDITTDDITTNDIATGDIATGDIAADDIAADDIAADDKAADANDIAPHDKAAVDSTTAHKARTADDATTSASPRIRETGGDATTAGNHGKDGAATPPPPSSLPAEQHGNDDGATTHGASARGALSATVAPREALPRPGLATSATDSRALIATPTSLATTLSAAAMSATARSATTAMGDRAADWAMQRSSISPTTSKPSRSTSAHQRDLDLAETDAPAGETVHAEAPTHEPSSPDPVARPTLLAKPQEVARDLPKRGAVPSNPVPDARAEELSARGQRQRVATSAVNRLTMRHGSAAEVELPELGRIRIDARTIAGEVDVDVVSMEAATVSVLQSVSHALEGELRNSAIELRNLDIRDEQPGDSPEGRHASKGDGRDRQRPSRSSQSPPPQHATDDARPTRGRVRIVL